MAGVYDNVDPELYRSDVLVFKSTVTYMLMCYGVAQTELILPTNAF